MKKLSFLFIAMALVSFISLNSCKTSTEPAETATEEVVEEAVVEEAVDTVAVEADSTVAEVVEEAAE